MNVAFTPLKHLLDDAREKHYEAGQVLIHAGDDTAELHILTSGIVKVYDIDEKGQEKILQLIKAPAILPLDSFFITSQPISWYYASLNTVTASVLSSEHLHEQIQQRPDVTAYILNWLATQTHELLVRLDGMNKTEAKDKLISILKFLRVYYAKPPQRGWQQIEFPVTHQLLAEMAGLARESVSIQMSQLQKEKIIRSRRPFIQVHRERLINYTK